jgi:hypothetical protein
MEKETVKAKKLNHQVNVRSGNNIDVFIFKCCY